jgi:hypothetical protein
MENFVAVSSRYDLTLRSLESQIHWQFLIADDLSTVANKYIGSFPPKGIVLYAYFAKFQLNSFAVRGINIYEGIISTERKEFANMAVSAAASSLTFVLEEEDLRRALVGTPL